MKKYIYIFIAFFFFIISPEKKQTSKVNLQSVLNL